MKTLWFACRLGAALAILLVGDRALAQGCNLGSYPQTIRRVVMECP